MDKDEARKAHIRKYRRIYRDIPEDAKTKARDLIARLADLAVTLDECEEHISEEGVVTEMQQGNYSIMRENPYSAVRDKTIKSFLAVQKSLNELLPDAKSAEAAKAGDALREFIAKGKPKA